MYYNGGGHFILSRNHPDVDVLARYTDLPEEASASDGAIAAVLTRNGKGKAILCSVHPEYPLNDPPARNAIAKLVDPPSEDMVAEGEKARMAWMEELLCLLGLEPPRWSGKNGSSIADEDQALLTHPTHPSPIFVLPLPLLPQTAQATFAASAIQAKLDKTDPIKSILRDGNDELHILDTHAFGGESSQAAITRELARRRREQPVFPPIEQLSLEPSDNTPAPPPASDFHSIPKIIITPSDLAYSPSWTPLFNFETYWRALAASRKANGKKHGQMRTVDGRQRPSLGDLVWYAETVTSTQTMLDR